MSEKKPKSCLFMIIGFVIGFASVFIVLFFLVIFITAAFSNSGKVAVKNNSWLLIDFGGKISEKPAGKIPSLLQRRADEMELMNFIMAIKNAKNDNKIKGIIINGDLTFYSKAHTEEIGRSLISFKESGKKIIAWFSNAENRNYSLCIYADEIYMPNTDSANLTIQGYSQSIPYLKKIVDKIGLDFNVIHIGNYKGTGENFVKDEMSDELKNLYYNFITSIFDQFANDLEKYRNIEKTKLSSLINSGETLIMNPDEAKKYGFIDGIMSFSDLKDTLSEKDFNSISIYLYARQKPQSLRGSKIAVIYAEGSISNYYTGESRFYGDIVGAKSFVHDLRKIKKDKSIKAVILRVNSPGGSALGSELILQEIKKLQDEKPVYVSYGPIAASGGYYISLSADKIYTLPSSITGSIGVVSILMNYEDLLDKIGINYQTVKQHEYDDFLANHRKPTEYEIEILRKSMEDIYKEFTSHVMKERKIKKEEITKIAEGRIWSGNQAVENKLADEIGGLIDVINYACKENNIKDYIIESYPVPPDFLDRISQYNTKSNTPLILKDKYFKQLKNLYIYYSSNGTKPSYYIPFYELP